MVYTVINGKGKAQAEREEETEMTKQEAIDLIQNIKEMYEAKGGQLEPADIFGMDWEGYAEEWASENGYEQEEILEESA